MKTNNISINLTKKKIKQLNINITKAAIKKIVGLMNKDPSMLGLKINVKKSGCADYSYVLTKISMKDENDFKYEFDGITLFIPKNIISIVNGMELDYIQEGLNYMFKFKNPNVKYTCGCGESFSILKRE